MIFHFSGSYIFIETSAPRRRGHKALLHSALFSPTGSTTKCLRFWYHMYGSQMGTMNIYLSKNGSLPGTKVWSLSGNQGNQWSSGTVAVKSNTQYSVSVIQNGRHGGRSERSGVRSSGRCVVSLSKIHLPPQKYW